jgi:hypothetical protein
VIVGAALAANFFHVGQPFGFRLLFLFYWFYFKNRFAVIRHYHPDSGSFLFSLPGRICDFSGDNGCYSYMTGILLSCLVLLSLEVSRILL